MFKKLSYTIGLLFIAGILYAGSAINSVQISGVNYGDIPVGVILPYSSTSTIPTDWLYCNGSSLSTVTYNQLFNVIHYSYGGAGASFNLPYGPGMFLRGLDTSGVYDADGVGRVIGSTETDTMQGHKHYTIGDASWYAVRNEVPGSYTLPAGGGSVVNLATTLTSSPQTDGVNGIPRVGAETRPRNLAVAYIIKYRQSTTIANNIASEVNSANSVNVVADKNNIGNGSTVNVMVGNVGKVIVSSTGTTITNTLTTNNIQVSGDFSAPGYYRKNALENGDMDIWQRGTSFTPAFAEYGSYTADRFLFLKMASGTARYTVSQSTDVPTVSQAGAQINNSFQVIVTTPNASPISSDYACISQTIEGYDFKRFVGQSAVLSFWVKSSSAGVYSVAFGNNVWNNVPSTDAHYITTYTITSSNTWQFVSVPITFNYSTGTWHYDNNSGCYVQWQIMNGSTTVNINNWVSGDTTLAATGQVNDAVTLGNIFRLTHVQLELGSTATNFEQRSFANEVALCQRYYEKSYDITTAPGTSVFGGWIMGWTDQSQEVVLPGKFNVVKRAVPTVHLYAQIGTIDTVTQGGDSHGATYGGTASPTYVGASGFATVNTSTALSMGLNWSIYAMFTADADFY